MQLVAGVAGAAIGFVYAGPAGAQYGFLAGSAAFGLFGPKPEGPGPGELKRPQVTLGAQIPRVYGRVRRTLQLVWTSDFRATEVEQGGKGTPEGPSSYTYSLDVYGWLADGDNVIAMTRIWINNELVWTALADSDSDSLAASGETSRWDDLEFLPGTSAQTPWAVYEDAVGATNAPAMRGVASLGIENLQVGGNQNVPIIEVEIVTEADTADSGEVILFRFDDDESEVGGRTVTVVGSPTFSSTTDVFGGAGEFGGSEYVEVDVPAASLGTRRITMECWFRQTPGPLQSTDINSFMQIEPAVGGAHYLRLGWRNNGFQFISDTGEGIEYLYAENSEPVDTWVFVRACFDPEDGQMWLFVNGVLLANDIIPSLIGGAGGVDHVARVGQVATPTVPYTDTGVMYIDDARFTIGRLRSTTNFSVPTAPLPYDPLEAFEPLPVDLQDVVDAEMSRVPGLDPSDWDSSDLAGVEVTGFTAIGPASQALADLGDVYHFDLVPGAPMRFVRRASATVGTITLDETGAGVDQATEPFSGLLLGNNDENPGVIGLAYPNIAQDHDVDFQTGDRLSTDGPDVRRVQTNVVLSPEQARGRAFSATVLQRSAAKTAPFALSDAYAAAEPGDAYTCTDVDANTYNLRIKRFTYADGVKQCDWELNDISALIDDLDTESDYTEAITVAPAGVADWIAWDGPKLRTEDEDAGYYVAVKTTGNDESYFYESPDDASYSQVTTHPIDSIFGSVSSIAGTLRNDGFFSENGSITVNVGEGVLSSSTRELLFTDRGINAFAVGLQGRYVVGQFITATLDSPGVYTLSGLLLGLKGTNANVEDIAVADDFLLLTNEIRRRPRSASQIGVEFYVKAVARGRAVTSVSGEAFTNNAEGLTPLSPVQLRAERDASNGNVTFTWNRRTRADTRFGGNFGDSCPLDEESERYRVRVYSNGTFTTLVRDLGVVTSASVAYSGADQTADFGSPQSTIYLDVRQISAAVGEGHPLQDAA